MYLKEISYISNTETKIPLKLPTCKSQNSLLVSDIFQPRLLCFSHFCLGPTMIKPFIRHTIELSMEKIIRKIQRATFESFALSFYRSQNSLGQVAPFRAPSDNNLEIGKIFIFTIHPRLPNAIFQLNAGHPVNLMHLQTHLTYGGTLQCKVSLAEDMPCPG